MAETAVAQSQIQTGVLGYAQITAGASNATTTVAAVSGLSVTVAIPTGGRRIRITAYVPCFYNTTATARADLSIWDGTVGSGTQLTESWGVGNSGFSAGVGLASVIVTPSAGSKTYNVGMREENGGTATLTCGTTNPAYILVEVI